MLPVFYHIPKAAGTFVLRSYATRAAHEADTQTYNQLAFVDIRVGGEDAFRLVVDDLNNTLSDTAKFTHGAAVSYTCSYEQWCDVKDHFNIIIVVVTGLGLSKPLEDILPDHNINNLYKFTILRDVFERSLSLFSYLNSHQSGHEDTHKNIPPTYEEYIESIYIEDSWLIRNLTNHCNSKPIDSETFNNACKILDDIHIYDFNGDIASYVSDIFTKCTGLFSSLSSDGCPDAYKNITQHKADINFNDLDKRLRKRFLDITYWDRKIYDKYITQKAC